MIDEDSSSKLSKSIRESYDTLAEEYARRIFKELERKPLDRELLDRFLSKISGQENGVCDIGCGPGHVARYLVEHGGRNVFGLDLSPRMIEVAKKLNPSIHFKKGNMVHLDLPDFPCVQILLRFYII